MKKLVQVLVLGRDDANKMNRKKINSQNRLLIIVTTLP